MRIDRVIPTARNLWREQARWRWTTIGAVVSTVGMLFTGGLPGGGGSSGAPPNGSFPQTSLPGGGPTVIMPGAPADLDADKRLRAFYQAYVDADANRAQAGLRCEKLVRALAQLMTDDERSAKPAQVGAIDEAKHCAPLIRQLAADLLLDLPTPAREPEEVDEEPEPYRGVRCEQIGHFTPTPLHAARARLAAAWRPRRPAAPATCAAP